MSRGFLKDTVDDVRTVATGWRWGRRQMVPRSAERFVPPASTTVFPTAWSRTKAGRAAREVVQVAGLRPLLHAEVRPKVTGLERLDNLTGPVLFVANHSSHLDTPLILCSLPDAWRRRTAVAAAADYFFDTWWRATGSAVAFNTFPIERRGGTMSTTPGDLLAAGWNVLVFPEGTRSPDGWVGEFRLGAAWLAVEHQVPVIPVAIRGSFAAMPRGRGWPRPGRMPVTVRFGDPVLAMDGESVRALGPRVRDAVARLLDEDETSWWEARRRAAAGETPDPSGPQVAPWRRVWEQTAPPRVDAAPKVWRE
ncbi:MAG: lysophospholipid acyltransferase family protein [Nocardioidaceae bacterium]